ncbi:hypothetical protein DBQ69_07420 [Lactobacillus sp. DS1_6]|nr:hypothetical protein Lpp74_01489 [Lacticaseibacillus paracasei subsp. paracasei Lpp74]EPC92772.1 hypothetical protein Lpp227_15325 [Lacticaseibacillus paracasei subsp. paracasei Lpp227]MCT3353902.1 hypothetical protein [Lacticaseibacillus paracasei]PTS46019.1 hypothetical protein DBQ69_07420 [Lactobacillus sp. DS1_6]PTS51233.1 hypothetical protein DBQ60_06775 [Lactobacillus sp. DS2_6]PTV40166.1 hypothetical protein DB344_06075 [Lactobacillus sp. DS13_6]
MQESKLFFLQFLLLVLLVFWVLIFCLKLITTLFSAALLALTLYYKDTDGIQVISEHRKTADDL